MTANSFIQQGIFITEPHQEILQAHMAELGNDFLKSLGFSECQFPPQGPPTSSAPERCNTRQLSGTATPPPGHA